jgi:hypothetical protein
MRLCGGSILLAALAGCLFDPGKSTCGNSIGCGNPPKIAELQTTAAGCPGCTGGGTPGLPFDIRFGDSLTLKTDTSLLSKPDSTRWSVALYPGSQVPVFSPRPVDTLACRAGAIILHPQDLRRARQAAPESDTGAFVFSLQIVYRAYSQGLEFDNSALLAGLALDTARKRFFCSPGNPLSDPGKVHYLMQPNASFQGRLEGWAGYSGGAKAAYAFIPGSPFSGVISMTDGRFTVDSLPNGGAFELRLLIVPGGSPAHQKVPSYILKSDPGNDADRIFRIQPSGDSLSLPENFF